MLIHNDPHLNLFWVYGSGSYLENNVTKALINTLESLPPTDVIAFLNKIGILSSSLPLSSVHIEYGLQRKPDKKIMEQFPETNRFLWGISPTGKAWDIGAIPLEEITFDAPEHAIDQIFNIISKSNPEDNEARHEAERQFNEIKELHDGRGESIPDGWILIYDETSTNKTPVCCVAIENKWYDLDPYQLNNHWEKSLFTTTKKTFFSTFYDIYSKLLAFKTNSSVVPHFLEYLSLLGYEPITSFSKSDFQSLDEEKLYRNLLYGKFFRYFNDDFMRSKFVSRDQIEYDSKRHRLAVRGIDYFNLFFDFYSDSGKFVISTEIGVGSRWVNLKLFPILQNDKRTVQRFSECYKGCYYARHVRLNNRSQSLYFWIQCYDTFDAYLQEIEPSKIERPKFKKADCRDALLQLGYTDDDVNIKKLNQWKFSEWHWLEYLRIIRDIDISKYCGENTKKLDDELEGIIIQQIQGIKMFNELLKS